MNDFNLAKIICCALEEAQKESRNNVYLIKLETLIKVKTIEAILNDTELSLSFDCTSNSIEICVFGYVFDSCTADLKRIFQTVDLFVIDTLRDGKVSIEMKILNAAEIIRRT